MKVTIFGSCRQTPISEHYDVTSIQEALTYPHYTKEIIQAIEFCKGDSQLTGLDTRYCFRTGLLTGKPIVNQARLQAEFAATDVFLVEIASRISYEWPSGALKDEEHPPRQVYLHHIAAEEAQYGFPYMSEVVQRDETDDEIEADILKIRELLSPAKVIIISHVCTRDSGRRYELVKLLEDVTGRHGIPFINPGKEMAGVEGLFQEEAAHHYTGRGNYMVGYLMANKVAEVIGHVSM